MLELTDADRAAIDRVRDEWRESWSGEPAGESLAILDEMLARHFLAAGIERAAQRVENGRFLHDDAPTARFARECAAAIRALLK